MTTSRESRAEKLDRELIELMNELRVALPGVQVMFAFLLTVPFSARFETVTSVQRAAFLVAFLATTAASILLMAPTAYHRIRWRQSDKEAMLRSSNRLALGGLIALAVAVSTVAFLIADVLLSSRSAAAVSACIVVALLWFWLGLPLSRRLQD